MLVLFVCLPMLLVDLAGEREEKPITTKRKEQGTTWDWDAAQDLPEWRK